MAPAAEHHDIVVLGASAGGVTALSRLVAQLPPDLPAAVFVVVHTAAGNAGVLPDILTRHGPLRAKHPLHGEVFERGRIYVAPPDNQLLVRRGYVHVVRGPKENGHRPAVDALFRTAAMAYGPRVIGVVLTGYLDCGTAGLLSIKARGGLAVAQDPGDAEVPEMPRSAVAHVELDHVVPLARLGPLLEALVREPAPRAEPAQRPELAELEGDEPGVRVEVVCPQCQGALTATELNGFEAFRCHVGHTFSLESLQREHAEEVERALWAAVRALEEAAAVSRRARARSDGEMQRRLTEKEQTEAQQAQLLRELLLRGSPQAQRTEGGNGEAQEDPEGEPSRPG